ncbi:MAG TPA: RNA polymerase sigma factor [Myxococcota bacterium]|nr:RNA polymerase sigma factor [Myxococcota bacterium]HRY93073.1 RNA polymerase sigma factor [Myxococcota bacterium]HSA20078.1 RNA polymerase sigma factor [Myxococcota bacterium]
MDAASDAELMVGIQAGDRAAFGALVARHQDGVLTYLARLTGERARAEDLAQDTFLRVWRQAGAGYQERGRLRAYLLKVATRLALTELRREARRRWLARLWLGNGDGHAAVGPPEDGGEVQRAIRAGLQGLPARLRAPLLLVELEGLSCGEAGVALGVRVGTVKSRIHRARAALAQALGPLLER